MPIPEPDWPASDGADVSSPSLTPQLATINSINASHPRVDPERVVVRPPQAGPGVDEHQARHPFGLRRRVQHAEWSTGTESDEVGRSRSDPVEHGVDVSHPLLKCAAIRDDERIRHADTTLVERHEPAQRAAG